MPVLGYGQLPPLNAAWGTWMMHHGATSLRGLQLLRGAVTGPYVKCHASFATAEADPIVADINGDGLNEIVIPAWGYGRVYAFRGTDCSLLWSSPVLSSSYHGSTSPAVGELDPTRTGLEIAVEVGNTNSLYVLSGTDGSIIWSAPLGVVLLNPPAIADIDGDGIGEIFVSSSYTTYAFRGNGTLLWSYPAGDSSSNVAVGDLGNDGTKEVVFVGYSSSTGRRVFALRATNGTLVWSYPIPNRGNVALADLDNDGQLEVVVVYHGGGVIALRHNGTPYWSRSLTCNFCPYFGYSPNSPTIADLNGDGLREILVGCYTELKVYALRGTDGSTLWSYGNAAACAQSSSRKIGDIDGNGALEVVLTSYHTGYGACTSCPNHLIVLNGATGAVEWTWQNPAGVGFEGLAIADVDNDGCMEVIVGPNSATAGSKFYVLDSPTPVSGCGILGEDEELKVEEEGNIGGVYLLVSPVKGGVNVEIGRKAFVEIYTTDGRKVKELEVDRSAFVDLKKGTYIFRVKGHNLYRTVIVR
jgi:hypothetical protein